jgi:hypothetical protein
MHFTMTYERVPDDPRGGPVTIGWLRDPEKTGVLYGPPERVIFRQTNRDHAKSAARCPAVINMESRFFMVRCPFDLHIGFGRDKDGRAVLINRAGPAGGVRGNKLAEVIVLVNESEWRYADRPTVQLKLPYVFIADEPVYVTQLDAFAHYRKIPLPGTIFGGRFPINLWPRHLMWALEWHDTDKDLILRRGDPLFYVLFEADGPERPVNMVEAERTPELLRYIEHVSGAVNYVNQTFQLFKQAELARPATLLTPRQK